MLSAKVLYMIEKHSGILQCQSLESESIQGHLGITQRYYILFSFLGINSNKGRLEVASQLAMMR